MAKVVLLHGLYMHGAIMWPLARKLEQRGWQAECLSYNSLAIDPDALFSRVLESIPAQQPAYLVGHSLGGVMLYHLAHRHPLPPGSRIVTLGSPLQGAMLAKKMAGWNLAGLMGNAAEHGLLQDETLRWHSETALGSLAGNTGFGMGTLLGAGGADSDGTVLISETQIDGMQDHITLPATHTSMLLSEPVAQQTDHFLRHGAFQRSACS
ncbi:esterase/lipase family protein [Ferrimonas pelagia]|uniref:Triacylglycerol lipase n=1 Tax=Ferrimonas pelagia TaxID=1177826 RepID=A0ABP9F927_9GAMM